jgi:hypothetical protein
LWGALGVGANFNCTTKPNSAVEAGLRLKVAV